MVSDHPIGAKAFSAFSNYLLFFFFSSEGEEIGEGENRSDNLNRRKQILKNLCKKLKDDEFKDKM